MRIMSVSFPGQMQALAPGERPDDELRLIYRIIFFSCAKSVFWTAIYIQNNGHIALERFFNLFASCIYCFFYLFPFIYSLVLFFDNFYFSLVAGKGIAVILIRSGVFIKLTRSS